jgi:hypothetical protein
VPIVFLTSLITGAEAGVRNGVLYLPKSVDRLTLLDSIRKLICKSNPQSPDMATV